ncbi:pyrophosphohydrolase domain-containing protein [Carnobacterium gallinarum]|uniref:haloacid dehalogenase n=1 Tax=Carnobacterium gallinarum TaxID=2749 RepID=UPI00055422E4|nr:haloacid dehalogenase [Carnobacterium gallinarum]
MSHLSEYEQVKEFHDTFHPAENLVPTAFSPIEALQRASFTTEEMIEFLYASVGGNEDEFDQLIAKWQESILQTVTKIKEEAKPVEDILIGQIDALTDANYFNYGSFVLMGVDPRPIFHFVHQANMGKLFPDGKPHYRETDGKVLKPINWEADFAPERKIKMEIERQNTNRRGT